LIIAAKKEWG